MALASPVGRLYDGGKGVGNQFPVAGVGNVAAGLTARSSIGVSATEKH